LSGRKWICFVLCCKEERSELVIDLEHVLLVDCEGVKLLARSEANGIALKTAQLISANGSREKRGYSRAGNRRTGGW
jgi:hypothetical protein